VGITCFVAMKIGHRETDRLYKRKIKPTLRALGICPVFMGDLEHNDNIDRRIIKEIEKCDFAIADLTFARPSVYYEAGFAERKVPVVYTCRRDHFRPTPDDEWGHLRVHFDLQMKPIVRWLNPEDSTFGLRLRKRIRFVIRPIVRAKEADARLALEEHDFRRLPLASRIASVQAVFRQTLQRIGWRNNVYSDRQNPWVGFLLEPRKLSLTVVWVQERFTQKQISERVPHTIHLLKLLSEGHDPQHIPYLFYELRRVKALPSGTLKNIKDVSVRMVFCALDRITPQRIAAALPNYAASHDLHAYEGTETVRVGVSPATFETRVVPVSVSVLVFDDIRSKRIALEKASALRRSR
jgi:hypothetical protein